MVLLDKKTPGVYVEEVPSGSSPIAGASTNTVGFVGFLPQNSTASIPYPKKGYDSKVSIGQTSQIAVNLKENGNLRDVDKVIAELAGQPLAENLPAFTKTVKTLRKGTLINSSIVDVLKTVHSGMSNSGTLAISGTRTIAKEDVANSTDLAAGKVLVLPLSGEYQNTDGTGPVLTFSYGANHVLDNDDVARIKKMVAQAHTPTKPPIVIKESFTIVKDTGNPNNDTKDTDIAKLVGVTLDADLLLPSSQPLSVTFSKGQTLEADDIKALVNSETNLDKINIQLVNQPYELASIPLSTDIQVGQPKLCTSFSEFKEHLYGDQLAKAVKDAKGQPVLLTGFPDPDQNPDLSYLVHAVYGFFSNGGTRCYILLLDSTATFDLSPFNAVEEVSILVAAGTAAPGTGTAAAELTTLKERSDAISSYCDVQSKQGYFYRFAILDSPPSKLLTGNNTIDKCAPSDTDYAAFYYPWIKVADPATKIMKPDKDGLLAVPPSGHVAGVYARVDSLRGVHKAPANEVVFGALGVETTVTKNQQGDFNMAGINCIRDLNGNIRIWGARTIGKSNGEFTYISTRRLFLYLRHSIDMATQWIVFEPNNPDLWAKIVQNVSAFLTNVWKTGALFGTSPQEAFYVKCDAENNPRNSRDLGYVVIDIGVAVTKPAEFVVFRISQWAGPGA